MPCVGLLSGVGGYRPAAFFGTVLAGFRAATAMFGVMLAAFSGTGIANIGAKSAMLRVKMGFAAHECGAIPAEIGAVDA